MSHSSRRQRFLRFEHLEDRTVLTSTGAVPVLHILTEIGPQDYHDFHPTHDLDHYRTVVSASGNESAPSVITSVNYSDSPGGADGHFPGDAAFPGSDADKFVLQVDAFFYVLPGQVGDWTFGVRSDDGHRLRVDGIDVSIDDATHAPQDSFGTVTLTEGLHSLSLVYFEAFGGASLELFAAPGFHTSFNGSFGLFGDSVFPLDGDILLRLRASDETVDSLADADALLAEPDHNVIGYFDEVSGGALDLTPAFAGDLDGVADGIVGPYEFPTTVIDVNEKRRMAIEAADADFDFSIYDTNPADGVLTPDELVIVVVTADAAANNHVGTFRPEEDFVPGTIQEFNQIDLGTGLAYIQERGQVAGEPGLINHRNLYYAHPHPTLPRWSPQLAQNHYLQSSQLNPITAATNADPIVITSPGHGLQSGDPVFIAGVMGNTAANGNRRVTRIDNNRFSLAWTNDEGEAVSIAGSGNYTGGGAWVTGRWDNVGDGANIRGTDIQVNADGIAIPQGFAVAAVGQWRGFATHVHEIMHLLHPDALDLYNYEDTGGVQAEINGYSIMGGTGSGTLHPDPWTKMRMGWVSPDLITAPTDVVLTDVATTGRVLKIPNPNNALEYFLIENRWGGASYDAESHTKSTKSGFPGPGVADEGLAIWHVDETYLPDFRSSTFTGTPFLAKLDASGTPNNAGDDLFDGATNFHVLSAPNSNWNDGTPSDVVVTAISPPGPTVTLRIDFSGVPQDALEPNDSFEFARSLGSGDQSFPLLSIHRDNEDYYRWTAPASGTLNVTVSFLDAVGDIDASLHQDDVARTLITSATSTTNNEVLTASVTAGESYLLRVYGFAGAMNPSYSLTLDGPDAPGDRFETNESFAEATPLGTGDVVENGLSIHSSTDGDFFRWYAPSSDPFNVSLIFQHSQGDLDLFLYDQDFNVVASSTSVDDDESIQFNTPNAYEPYYIRVVGFNGAINPSYDIGVASPDIPIDYLEFNDGLEFSRFLGFTDQTHNRLTIHAPNNSDFYYWRSPADGLLTVDLQFLNEVGDLDLTANDSVGSILEVSSSTTDNESLQLNVEKGHNYFFHVYGFDGAVHHDYSLTLDGPEIPPDRLEANDSFAAAYDLGSGDRAEPDLNIHDANNDDYYRWVAPATGQLQLNIFFEQVAGDLDLYLYDGPTLDDLVASAQSTTDSEQIAYTVSEGTAYYFHVDGYLGATNFNYQLTVDGPEPVSADFDGDGDVDLADLMRLQRGYGTPSPQAQKNDGDADNDFDVDAIDLGYWQSQLGQGALPVSVASAAVALSDQPPLADARLTDAAIAFATRWSAETEDELVVVEPQLAPSAESFGTANFWHGVGARSARSPDALSDLPADEASPGIDPALADEALERAFG